MKIKVILLGSFFAFGLLSRALAQEIPAETQEQEAMLDQISSIDEDINRLKDLQSDATLKYKRFLFKIEKESLEDKLTLAQKAGDSKTADAVKGEIQEMETLRDATWDEDIPLLEARHKLDLLKIDAVLEKIQKKLDDPDALDKKDIEFLQETKDELQKYKPLLDQRLELNKQLVSLRKAEDFQAADQIYEKLKDIRKQIKDLISNSRNQLIKKLGSSSDEDTLNL